MFVTNTNTDEQFAQFVDRCAQALAFWQGVQLMAMVAASQSRPYVATAESSAATRQALGAEGLTHVPGPRSVRLTAAERRDQEHKDRCRRLGYLNGRFIGERRAA